MFALVVVFAVTCAGMAAGRRCERSVTTASGLFAPRAFCSGDLIFEDQFDFLDHAKWQHEITLGGGGNWEFQWYTNDRANSFVDNGVLHIKPSLTVDSLGYDALYRDTVDLGEVCTNPKWLGCKRTGTPEHVLNPVRSARLRTLDSFSFKYGRVEVRAKMPAGDWIWPAIWLLPTQKAYGDWPLSGEIDIVESRGNRDLVSNGRQIGTQAMGSTLHYGVDWANDGWSKTHWDKTNRAGFDNDFHLYGMKWTPNKISFYVDGERIGSVSPSSGGFWDVGGWGNKLDNPWKGSSKMAPFDQEFYLIINNAVGGTNHYFPDSARNPGGKPWANNSPKAATDFWENRNQWLPTWNLAGSNDAALQVDYVKAATDFWENRNQWLPTWNLAGSNDAALQVDYVKVYAL